MNNAEEIDEKIEQYFSTKQWSVMSNYEKVSYSNALKNYEMLLSIGLDPQAPKFMQKKLRSDKKWENADEGAYANEDELMPENVENFVIRSTSSDAPFRKEFSTANFFEGFEIPEEKKKPTLDERAQPVIQLENEDSISCGRPRRAAARICYKEVEMDDDDDDDDIKEVKDNDFDGDESKDEDENSDESDFKSDISNESSSGSKSGKRRYKKRTKIRKIIHLPTSLTLISDTKISNNKQRPLRTMPLCLSVAPSTGDPFMMGIWTECELSENFVFGPYEGRIFVFPNDGEKNKESFLVWKKDELVTMHEDPVEEISNWMVYVNYSQTDHNLIAFQYNQGIFYRTTKPILPHTELLVWYSDDYNQDLGFKTENGEASDFVDSLALTCSKCSTCFSDFDTLERHIEDHERVKLRSTRKYKCELCTFTHNHHGTFNHHKWIHTQPKEFPCHQCMGSFSDTPKPLSHLTLDATVQRPVCHFCRTWFYRVELILKHNQMKHWLYKPPARDESDYEDY